MSIHRGEIIAILGPSGSGKSTLLRLLNFLEQPTKGKIYFDGTLVESNEIKRRVFYEVTEDIIGAASVLDEFFSASYSGDRYNIFDLLIKNLSRIKVVESCQVLKRDLLLCLFT